MVTLIAIAADRLTTKCVATAPTSTSNRSMCAQCNNNNSSSPICRTSHKWWHSNSIISKCRHKCHRESTPTTMRATSTSTVAQVQRPSAATCRASIQAVRRAIRVARKCHAVRQPVRICHDVHRIAPMHRCSVVARRIVPIFVRAPDDRRNAQPINIDVCRNAPITIVVTRMHR